MNLDFLDLNFILLSLPVILLSLTVHEYFHAWTANKLGDDTAARMGRLTLNPIAHLDLMGTIFMIVAKFGWAKPVPIDARNFEDPKKGTLLVAIAGPLSNLAMAIGAGLILRMLIPNLTSESIEGIYGIVIVILILTVVYGLALAVFNMIPIPPLDGSRVVYGLLPDKYLQTYSRIEPYGIFILFGVFIFARGILKYLFYPISLLSEQITGYTYGQLWGLLGLILNG